LRRHTLCDKQLSFPYVEAIPIRVNVECGQADVVWRIIAIWTGQQLYLSSATPVVAPVNILSDLFDESAEYTAEFSAVLPM
jgi:hypothetical protein